MPITQQLTETTASVTTMLSTAANKKLKATENSHSYVLHHLGKPTFRTPGYINKVHKDSSIRFQETS